MPEIHPTAVVDSRAQIADDAVIGPHCIIGPHVSIGSKTRLLGQACVTGYTTIGARNLIYPNVCLGAEPQDYGFAAGTVSYLRIGDGNVFREGVSVHVGTKAETATVIGNENFLMVNSHLGHNCLVGNQVIMANCALMAGYVEVQDGCFISGLTAVRQFCRIGRFAMMWGLSAISKDLPPFMIVNGRNGAVAGVNVVALRRRNFPAATINALRMVHKLFFRGRRSVKTALDEVRANVPLLPEVEEFITFVETSPRGVLLGRDTRAAASAEDEAGE
jgi:UDP-N-acetylglucosamine acyltransferase